MEFQIRKLSYRDEDHIEQICQLLNNSYDQEISRYFIYRDRNYQAYLSNSLRGSSELIYVVTSAHELIGFAQLKISPDTVFLNNIIIKLEYRGQNLALLLLKSIAQEVLVQNNYPQTFALDVFRKNASVVNWYLRLGMNIKGHKFWYNLLDYYMALPPENSTRNSIAIRIDENGFSQMFLGQTHIGTLVNRNAIVLRSTPSSDVLTQLKGHFQQTLEAFALISEQELDFPLIDQVLRMEMPLTDLHRV